MTDIAWDLETNDLAFSNRDFAINKTAGRQAGALLLLKSCTNILLPQWGAAIEERYANITQRQLDVITSDAKVQMENDGAAVAIVSAEFDASGKVDINLEVKYKGE
ncbi:MAG: hypothetical protein RSF40_04900 [Oscillospiraceae bacterium]